MEGCVDENNNSGAIEWSEGSNIYRERIITVTPEKTTTYKATCLLDKTLSNGDREHLGCSREETVIVDKKCEGVMVSVSSKMIKDGEAVLLTSSGCVGTYQWRDAYPSNTVLSTSKNFIAYPATGETTYTLTCIDNSGASCVQQSEKVKVACSFKLAVRTHNNSNVGSFVTTNTGTIFVEGIGCEGDKIDWTRVGGKGKWGNKIDQFPWGKNGVSYYPVEQGFTVNATCHATGCKTTTGFVGRPPTSREGDCSNYSDYEYHLGLGGAGRADDLNRVTIKSESGATLSLKLLGAPDYKWDDNRSTEDVRIFQMPQTTTVYSASTDKGCRTSFGYQPKKLSNENSVIPCIPFTLSGPTQVEIPESATSVKAQLIASGCSNGLENASIIWKREGVQFSSGLQETATITFQETDKNKTHRFSATCSLTGETKTLTIKVTKEIPAPRAPKHPCDFYLYTNKGQYYDTFLESNSETVEIFTWGMGNQIQAYLQNDNNSIISGGPTVSYKNGEAVITVTLHVAKRGSFALKVSNWVGGTFCEKWIYINVDNNRGFNADYVPATFYYPVNPITKNCEQYRGSSEIPIIRDAYKQSVYSLQHSALKDFGALSLYVNGQTVFYPGVATPDKLALVDKVCNASRGTSQWYNNAGMTSRLNDFITFSGYSAAIVDNPDFENSKTYYARCTFRNGSYCDKTVVINPRMPSNGRLSAQETATSSSETEANCTFSKQKATDILLTDLLCQKLNLLPGKEREKLLALREALLAQQVTLGSITDAMVADLAAGKCSEVVKALTVNIMGSESVDIILTELLNKENTDRILDQVLDKISDTPTDTCSPPPFDLEESSFSGGRVAANVIDYNRYFISPDGRAVKLPPGAQPKFYNFGYRWGAPPKGTLQGFVLAGGEQYFADITNSPNKFSGYIQVKDPVCNPKVPYTGDLYKNPPAGSPVYYLEPYNTDGDCGYNWIEANYTFSPTSDGSLKQIVPVPTGLFTNLTRFTGCVEETDWVTGADGIRRKTITDAGSKFLLEDKNGDITVKGQWKSFGKCPECAQLAEEALQRALAKARKKHGKLNENTNVVEGIEMPYGPAGMVKYTDMKIGDIIKNMAETYNSLLEKAKVPAEAWEPGKRFYVRDETAVISGAIDQSLEELKDIPDLIGLGLTLVSDPEGAYEQLKSFGQQMSWEKARQIGVEVAKGAVFADEFEKGGKFALHGTGRAGVVIAKTIITGGAGLLAVLKDVPNQLRKKLDDIAALLARLRSKLKDASLADVLEKNLANDDLYRILDAHDDLVESWEVLQKGGKTELKLTKAALEKVKDLLGDAKVQKALGTNYADELAAICKAQGGFNGAKSLVAHLDDVKAFCNKFDDKEGFDQVVTSMKNTNGNVQDGLQHVLTQVNKAEFDAGKVGKFDMEFEGEGLPCNKCKFDVEMVAGNKPKLIEYKSYLDASRIQLPQFLNYIASVSDLSEMKYIFNAAKLSTEQAKEGMKVFMRANETNIIASMKPSLKTGLGISVSDLELTNTQIQKIVDIIVESK